MEAKEALKEVRSAGIWDELLAEKNFSIVLLQQLCLALLEIEDLVSLGLQKSGITKSYHTGVYKRKTTNNLTNNQNLFEELFFPVELGMIRLFGAMYLASFHQYYISSLTLGKKTKNKTKQDMKEDGPKNIRALWRWLQKPHLLPTCCNQLCKSKCHQVQINNSYEANN